MFTIRPIIAIAYKQRKTMRTSRWLITTAAAGLLMLTAACSGDTPATADPAPADGDNPVVLVADMTYEPKTQTVPEGTTVTWRFDDGAIRHDVAGDGFKSELMASGTFSHTFDTPGTYEYICTAHPGMAGTVEVTK
jgi:plastocyanin